MKLTKVMQTVLEALPGYEGGALYPGASMAEIKASGGTPYALRRARDEGWAGMYTTNNREAPSYYRTETGTRALETHYAAHGN